MPKTVIIGTKKGAVLLTRMADGTPWARSLALKGWSVTASAQDSAGRTYLAASSDIYGPALFVSDDGQDWRQLESAPRFADDQPGNALHRRMTNPFDDAAPPPRQVDQIWTLHAQADRLLAGVSEAGLFVSEDRGASWAPVEGLNEHDSRPSWEPGAGGLCAHTILSDAANPDRIWVGISAAGFFRSDDGGKTFAKKNDGIAPFAENSDMACVHCVTHDPARADLMFRQDHRGVYRSKDGGDHWEAIETGLPVGELSDGHRCSFGFPIGLHRASGTLFVAPQDSDGMRVPAGGGLSVYRSRDGGTHWEAASTGLPAEYLSGVLRGAMDVDQGDPGGIYFGTTAGSVFASTDLGDTWQEIASGLPRVLSVRVYAG